MNNAALRRVRGELLCRLLGATGLPPITSPIQLNGHGSSIVRQSSQNFRILRIRLSAPVLTTTISDLTISGGLAASE